MGLQLKRGDDGQYRRTWYAIYSELGKHVNRKLKTPLRGEIPTDAAGRFSLSLTGDATFEASKAAARAELREILEKAREAKAEERDDPGYTERQVYRKLKGRTFDRVKLDDLAKRNATRERYQLTGDKRADKYNQSVFDILEHFAKWARTYSANQPKANQLEYLTDVTAEAVGEYYKEISAAFTWQTFRKYVFTLKSVYAFYVSGNGDNPFRAVYKDAYTYKKDAIDKTEVVHEAPDAAQIRRVWDYTRKLTGKPYLHRLAVLSACTGMRIGDCCKLTWDKVDMLDFKIHTKTSKAGKIIGVQIFDYDPASPDYHEILGELRRELEAANVEAADGERYVIPEAARIYQANPSRINKEGKAIFARALFGTPDPEPATLVGEDRPKATPAEILAKLAAADIPADRAKRLAAVYELYATGKSYAQISLKTGRTKGAISEDLAWIERHTGEKIRPGNPYVGANPQAGLRKLLEKTRRERGQGQRAACLYGWHSFRVSFVIMSIDMGVALNDLKEIVGHSTIDMVLHYYNPKELKAAENMRQQNRRRNLAMKATAARRQQIEAKTATAANTGTAPANTAATPAANGTAAILNAVAAILTDDQKKQLAAALGLS